MTRFPIFLAMALACLSGSHALADIKLSGFPIGTQRGYQYETGSVQLNIQYLAFDGRLDTYFATEDRSYTWVGLDLLRPHVITRVGWSPRNDSQGERRLRTGVIQGANRADFLDAIPIYVIREDGKIGEISYGDVECSRAFRYVRFVSTGNGRCNIAELEFYGYQGNGDDSHLFQVTNLPTVVINTVDAVEPFDKETNIESNIIIIDNNRINIDKSATVRERGNGSRTFPKKPWRIKFDKKQQPLNAPAKAKKWTLINNYGDKTLMRNLVAFEIARRLDMRYVSYAQPVDVILNGEYKGCYQLCDQMEVNEGRLDITEMDEDDISGENLTGGYFFEVDAYAYYEPYGSWFQSDRGIPVTIKSPDDGGTPEQYYYISHYFQLMEDAVYAGHSRSILDMDSFLQHFIAGELSGNTDTYWSTYMYKERGNPIIYTGPVWDFDLAFDNDQRTYPVNHHSGFLFDCGSASSANGMRDLVRRIVTYDRSTAADLTRVWSLARNDRDLSAGGLGEYIDSLASVLQESQDLNFKRWPILDQRVHQNPRALGSFDAEVQALKDYLETRFPRLDELMKYDPSISVVDVIEPDKEQEVIMVGRTAVSGGSEFTIHSVDGTLCYSGKGNSPELAPGIYIITTGGHTSKVLVK